MLKRILFIILIAFTCSALLTGCGKDGSDGADGADADTDAIIAELKAQLESGEITIAQYEEAIAELEAQLTAATKTVSNTESCSVCHDSAELHEVTVGLYEATGATLTVTSATTATVTFKAAKDGVNRTDAIGLRHGSLYFYDSANSGYNRYGIDSYVTTTGPDANGTYTSVIDISADTALTAKINLLTTNVRYWLSYGNSGATNTNNFEVVENYPASPNTSITDESCLTCHSDFIWQYGTNKATNAYHHGSTPKGAESCIVCHSRYDSGSGKNFMKYVHGIHSSGEAEAGYKTVNSKSFSVHYPQSLANCVTCHNSDDSLEAATDDSQFTYEVCMTCHDGWSSFDDLPSAIDHTAYGTATTCTTCHSNAAGIAPTFADLHTGVEKARTHNIVYYTPEITVDTANSKISVVWGAFTDNDESGTYTTGDTFLDVTQTADTTKPIFMQSYTERVVDGVAKSDGVRILVGYYGFGTQDVVAYDGYTKTNLTTTSSSTSGYTTYNSTTGKATTTIALKTANITSYEVTKGIVGIIGIPFVDGENAYVTSVTKEFNIDGSAVTARTAVANNDKCDACHTSVAPSGANGIAIHLNEDSSGAHGHTAIGNVDTCRICHNSGSAAGHYAQQSRSIDSYLHAIHAEQPTTAAYDSFTIKYPNYIKDCTVCHDSGTYEAPSQTNAVGGVVSGSEQSDGTLLSADQTVNGPGAVACGSCHKAMAIVSGDSGTVTSINAHTASFGYRVSISNMTFLEVLQAVFDLL